MLGECYPRLLQHIHLFGHIGRGCIRRNEVVYQQTQLWIKARSLNRPSADVESLLYREVAIMGKTMSQNFCVLEFFWKVLMMWWGVSLDGLFGWFTAFSL
jgi:hypothetical protein